MLNWRSNHIESLMMAVWLTVTEWLCYILSVIWTVCCNHNPSLPLFMTYQLICDNSNTTFANIETWTAYSTGAPDFISGFCLLCFVHSFIFCLVFCRIVYVVVSFLQIIVLFAFLGVFWSFFIFCTNII